jgi:hypothetical protein
MNDTLYVEGLGAITRHPTLADFPLGPRVEMQKPDLSLLERTLRRGLSDVTRLFMHASQLALVDAGVGANEVHVVFGSAYGELATAEALMDQAYSENSASPARFRHSVHNSAPGLLSISAHNQLPSTAIAAGHNTVAMGLFEASAQLRSGAQRVLLVFAEEAVPNALSPDHEFGPAAVALVLSQSLSAKPPRASLSHIARAKGDTSSLRDPFAGENHPLGPAVLIAQALEAGRSETIRVGEGPTPWCVELRVLQAEPPEPPLVHEQTKEEAG